MSATTHAYPRRHLHRRPGPGWLGWLEYAVLLTALAGVTWLLGSQL